MKIDQYLAKIWTKYNSSVFGPHCIRLWLIAHTKTRLIGLWGLLPVFYKVV